MELDKLGACLCSGIIACTEAAMKHTLALQGRRDKGADEDLPPPALQLSETWQIDLLGYQDNKKLITIGTLRRNPRAHV